MSFSKAKIQRFNELGSEVPPPGAYDPKFDNKVKGLVIEKCDRFLDTKSTYSTECSVSTSGKNSTSISFPVFRTPQCRKRLTIKTGQSSIETKNKLSFLTKNQNIKYECTQHLADLQVECLNKDKTIQEHEKHLEEMKDNMRKLENVLEELHNKQTEIEEQHTKDIETMAKLQQEVLDNHDKKHQTEVQMLCSQLLEMSEEKEQEFSTRRTIEIELRNRATELSKRITMLEELCTKKEEDKMKIEILETEIEELLNTITKLECDRDNEIQLLQEKLLYEKCKLDVSVADLMQAHSNEVKLEERPERMLQLHILLCAFQHELEYFRSGHITFLSSTEKISDYTRLEKHLTCIRCVINDFLKEEKIFIWRDKFLKTDLIEASTMIKKIEEMDSNIQEELQGAVVEKIYEATLKRLHGIQAHIDATNRQQLIIYLKQQQWEDATNHYEQKYLEQLNEIVAKVEELYKLIQTFAEKVEKLKQMTEYVEKMIEDAKAVASERLTACRIESEERVKRTIIECDAKVNVMIKDTQNTVEEEMQLAAERYNMCLARMEVERIALDEKLSQRDAEITKLSATLEELRSSVETQESFSQSLQIELDRAEAELAEKKEELRSLKDHIRAEAAEMVARRKRFEIIMAENQASVAALTNRLAQSNAEVERLQHELKRGEDCIDEHRDLLSVMRNNSQLVHEQVHVLMKELDAQRELVSQLEAGSLSEFESIKLVFEAKIENLKQMAAKEITKVQNDCEIKCLQHEEMKKEMYEIANELKKTKDKILEEFEYQSKTLEEKNQLIQAQATQHKEDMNKANSRIEELINKVQELEDKEKYTKETLLLEQASLLDQERVKWETLESTLMRRLQEERELREKTEEEVKKVTKSYKNLRIDYDEINEKYTEIIGHQNPKQRIKHVTQLKDKIYQLEQELCAKTKLVEQQQKTIKSLKTEEKRSQCKGKENQGMGCLLKAHLS